MTGQLALAVDTLPADRRADLDQWFTDPSVAARLVRWCGSIPMHRVLEPSAGGGSLVRAIEEQASLAQITAHEIDPEWAAHLRATTRAHVIEGDYLAAAPPAEPYDLAVVNSPFADGQDVAFLGKVMDESRRVVAVLRSAVLHGKRAHAEVWSRAGWGVVSVAMAVGRWSFETRGARRAEAGRSPDGNVV